MQWYIPTDPIHSVKYIKKLLYFIIQFYKAAVHLHLQGHKIKIHINLHHEFFLLFFN
jgi:hypothetical protein